MSTGHLRRLGYLEGLRRQKLPVDHSLLVPGSFRESGGYEAMRRLLNLSEPPTAVFAVNDLAAIGAIRAIEDAGLRVPRDISVVGFNDLSVAIGTVRQLTTVRLPLYEMGGAAAERLLAQIAGKTDLSEPVVMPVELVIRQSTGQAPA
jgi:LacI family transcriptional regulator